MTAIDRRTGLTGSVAIKQPVRVATTANITLSGEQTIDGVAVVADDRVLVKDQSTGADNGIYIVATSGWSRAPDMNGERDVVKGTLVYVTEGTVSADVFYRITTANPIVVGTTSLTFTESGATALQSVSPFALTLLDDLTAAAARTTLGAPSNAEAILDTIVDAAGDLIVGTAADTVARLAKGAALSRLRVNSAGTALEWTAASPDVPMARRAVADLAATVTSADAVLVYTSISTARAITLPAASTFVAGQPLVIVDGSGSVTQTVTLSLVPNGSDTIAGSNTTQVCINEPRGRCVLVSNGSTGWDVLQWSVVYVNTLAADAGLGAALNFATGPTVAQGTVGRWRADGTAHITAGAADRFIGKMWDGTTVISSSRQLGAGGATDPVQMAFGGHINAPAGNIRISAATATRTDGSFVFNASGASADCTISVRRVS